MLGSDPTKPRQYSHILALAPLAWLSAGPIRSVRLLRPQILRLLATITGR
jgi:hypothetical protein